MLERPLLLGSLDPGSVLPSVHSLAEGRVPVAGEVDPIGLHPGLEPGATMLRIMRRLGMSRRLCHYYSDFSLLALNGSVGVHDDPGLGLILNWIVADINPSNIEPEIVAISPKNTQRKYNLQLAVGDIFLFDADQPHAWVSNGESILVQVSVDCR